MVGRPVGDLHELAEIDRVQLLFGHRVRKPPNPEIRTARTQGSITRTGPRSERMSVALPIVSNPRSICRIRPSCNVGIELSAVSPAFAINPIP